MGEPIDFDGLNATRTRRTMVDIDWVWCTNDPDPSGGVMRPHWKSCTGNLVRIFPPDDQRRSWIVRPDNENEIEVDGIGAERIAFVTGRAHTL